jgi:hypothetical protein
MRIPRPSLISSTPNIQCLHQVLQYSISRVKKSPWMAKSAIEPKFIHSYLIVLVLKMYPVNQN